MLFKQGSIGDMELEIPRDRNSSFESQLIKKYETDISDLGEKIISMYARQQS
jgi:putative transposase